MTKLKDEVKRLRDGLGLSQAELAAAAGKTAGFISQIETGHRKSLGEPETVFALCRKLGVPPDHFDRLLSARSTGRLAGATALELKGEVEAGKPIAPYEGEAVQMVSLREHFPSGCFLLRVRGDSMEGFGIHPGDLVVVRPTRSTADVNDGDIVVAQMDGGYTLKAADKRSDTDITLYALYKGKPAKRMRPDDGDGVSLVGVVVKVLGDRKVPPSRRPKGAE